MYDTEKSKEIKHFIYKKKKDFVQPGQNNKKIGLLSISTAGTCTML